MITRLLSNASPNRSLTLTWAALILLTLLSALLAEQEAASATMVLFICLSFAVKGSLVTEYLMGLYQATRSLRSLMLGYFIVLPILIGLAIMFPDLLQRITTL